MRVEHVQRVSSPLSVSSKHSGFYPEQKQRQPRNLNSLGLIPKHASLTFPSSLDKVTRITAAPPPALGPSLLTLGPLSKSGGGKQRVLPDPPVNPVSGPRTYFQTNQVSESHTSGLSLLPLIS